MLPRPTSRRIRYSPSRAAHGQARPPGPADESRSAPSPNRQPVARTNSSPERHSSRAPAMVGVPIQELFPRWRGARLERGEVLLQRGRHPRIDRSGGGRARSPLFPDPRSPRRLPMHVPRGGRSPCPLPSTHVPLVRAHGRPSSWIVPSLADLILARYAARAAHGSRDVSRSYLCWSPKGDATAPNFIGVYTDTGRDVSSSPTGSRPASIGGSAPREGVTKWAGTARSGVAVIGVLEPLLHFGVDLGQGGDGDSVGDPVLLLETPGIDQPALRAQGLPGRIPGRSDRADGLISAKT